jgi:hypothetical protein
MARAVGIVITLGVILLFFTEVPLLDQLELKTYDMRLRALPRSAPQHVIIAAIDEKSLGAKHPNVARDLDNLALLLQERGDWIGSLAFHRRAKPILVGRGDADGGDRNGFSKALLASNTWSFRAHAVRSIAQAPRVTLHERRDLSWHSGRCKPVRRRRFRRCRPDRPRGPARSLNSSVTAKTPLRAARRRKNAYWLLSVGAMHRTPRLPARVWLRWIRHSMCSTRGFRASSRNSLSLLTPNH